MPNTTITKCPGLVTAPNSESAGLGALKQCVNAVLRRGDLLEKRRPVRQYTTTASFVPQSAPLAIFGYNKRLHTVDASNRWWVDDGTNTATLVALTPLPPGVSNVTYGQFTTAEMSGNCYIPFAGQPLKLDSIGAAPYFAGLQAVSDLTCSTVALAAGYLVANAVVGYRVIFGFTDANGNLILSPPSGRLVYTNGASQGNVSVQAYIPSEIIVAAASIQNACFYQVYRTSVVASGDPGDEMGLVYQALITATDIANAYVRVTDLYSDAVNKGPALYTNASQQGIANANYQPPLCTDIAAFKNAMFYSNTTSKQRTPTTLIGIPDQMAIQSIAANTPIAGQSTYTFLAAVVDQTIDSTMKLAVTGTTGGSNDGTWQVVSITATTVVVTNAGVAQVGVAGTAMAGSVIVGTRNYYATYAAENPNTQLFNVTTTGTTAQQIGGTAQSLARVVARDALLNAQATMCFYASGPDDAPGKLQFEEKSIGGATFNLQVKGTAFSNKFAPTLTAAKASRNDKAINRVYYSKYGQPEHVPLANYFDIGGKTAAILRIVPLRDSLFVFKEDGIFRITGDGTTWNVARFDDTLILVTANAIATIFNTIYALTNKGIVAITDNGLRLASESVSNLVRIYTDSPAAPTVYTHSSERDGLVHFMISSIAVGVPSRIGLCYSYKTNTWSTTDLTPQGANMQLMGGPGANVGGTIYRLNTDQVYAEAAVDANENPALGTITASAPVPSDRYRLTINSVNAGASQINASLNSNAKLTASVGDLVMENIGSIGVAGLWAVTAVNGSILTLSNTAANGAIGTQAGFQFATSPTTYLYAPISTTIEYQPFTAGDDKAVKRFPATSVLLDAASTATLATIGHYTEIARTEFDQVTTATGVLELRALVPLTMNRCRRLSMLIKHATNGQHLFIKGVSYDYQNYPDGRSVE
jgi:hypothetical protein